MHKQDTSKIKSSRQLSSLDHKKCCTQIPTPQWSIHNATTHQAMNRAISLLTLTMAVNAIVGSISTLSLISHGTWPRAAMMSLSPARSLIMAKTDPPYSRKKLHQILTWTTSLGVRTLSNWTILTTRCQSNGIKFHLGLWKKSLRLLPRVIRVALWPARRSLRTAVQEISKLIDIMLMRKSRLKIQR